MTVSQIISLYPQTKDILSEYGLHCFGCAFNALESLEEGCRGHGFSVMDIDNLVGDLNDFISTQPAKPQELTVTESAARSILDIAQKEAKLGDVLVVIAEPNGGFCMEFRKEPATDEKIFSHVNVPDIRIVASPDTLNHIGGSTIDFREGRFKLDVPDVAGCACGGKCNCK